MKKEIRNLGSPKWGLFNINFWKHPILWLKDLKIYHDRLKYLKKHGYSPEAEWETFNWFIDVMRDILKTYRYKRCGTGWYLEEPYEEGDNDQWERNIAFYNSELDKMLELLDKMDEDSYDNNCSEEIIKQKQEACDKFFKMFAEYFYSFWD